MKTFVVSVVLCLLLCQHATSLPLPAAPSKSCTGKRTAASVTVNAGKVSVVEDFSPDTSAAFGHFSDGLFSCGWGELNVATNPDYEDLVQMRAAGVLEGYLTAERMADNAYNMHRVFFDSYGGRIPGPVQRFLEKQDSWSRQQVKAHPEDGYWRQLGLLLAQFDGLVEGFQIAIDEGRAGQGLPAGLDAKTACAILNLVGDLLDIEPAVMPSSRKDWFNMPSATAQDEVFASGHCSALIRIADDLSDMWFGHSSWFTYSATNRIFKHYCFQVKEQSTAARKTSFSSYAGYLESLDDFYMMSSGLAMVQTTNNVFNTSLYDLVKPESLFAWQRVRLASAMAHNGSEWAHVVGQHNSGTYNNAYMVVDLNRFTPGKPLPSDVLWYVEQIPGLVKSADVTQELNLGYWPSYNVPFFPEVYDKSGYPQFVAQHGEQYSYALAPRAEIFRRDAGKVNSFEDFKGILRSNNYTEDPFSQGSAGNAICSRGDLGTGTRAGGCYDTKATSYSMAKALHAEAVNGPTTAGGTLPPFRWDPDFEQTVHRGLPEVYDFEFVPMTPNWEDYGLQNVA